MAMHALRPLVMAVYVTVHLPHDVNFMHKTTELMNACFKWIWFGSNFPEN